MHRSAPNGASAFRRRRMWNVHRAFLDKDVSAPDAIQELRAVKSPAPASASIVPTGGIQAVRHVRERRPTVTRLRMGIHFYRTGIDLAVGWIPGPAQQGLHPSDQFPWAEKGLTTIVVDTGHRSHISLSDSSPRAVSMINGKFGGHGIPGAGGVPGPPRSFPAISNR